MNKQFDVIIATRNRGTLIINTLQSLQTSTYEDFTVWVIDQSSDDATQEAIKPFIETDARFRSIHTTTIGVNAGRNIGINAGTAPLVALTDDDCHVSPTWLASLAAEYEAYPDVTAVFGQIVPGDITFLDNGQVNMQQITRLQQILPMAKIDHTKPIIFSGDRMNLGFGHGANMSFRRSTFDQFGLFDEYLGAGAPLRSWPERDYGYRILAGGGKILYSPNVHVHHYHWREWDEVWRTYRNYAIGTGAAVGKYIRLGDWASLELLLKWFTQQGIRQILSGIIKWQSWQKSYVGLLQLIYPWVGLLLSMQYKVDKQQKVYVGKRPFLKR